MSISESKENYLEIIYILSQKLERVKAIDIAKTLNFSRASVSVALKQLKEAKYISVGKDSSITLTPQGRAFALGVYEKHEILSAWLVSIGVSREAALEDACKIEHIISEESFNAIKKHLKNPRKNK